jgi:hypothetical protein
MCDGVNKPTWGYLIITLFHEAYCSNDSKLFNPVVAQLLFLGLCRMVKVIGIRSVSRVLFFGLAAKL